MADQESLLTPKDVQQLVMALGCLKEGPLVNSMFDIPKFAKKAGIAEGSAKNVLIRLRKKIDEAEADEGKAEVGADTTSLPPGSAKKTPKISKKKKVVKAGTEEEEEALT